MIAFTLFAETAGGIGALGINLQGFLFQLVTFVLVLLILRKFVYHRLVSTLEERRMAVEKSLDQAKETATELEQTREKIVAMLKQAQAEANDIIATGQKEATTTIEAAETKARKTAEHIIDEAHTQLTAETEKARQQLKKETAQLVALATERVIGQKLDAQTDRQLIEQAIHGVKR